MIQTVLLSAAILAQNQTPNYGYTTAQMDAMGLEKWIAICESKRPGGMPEYEYRDQVSQYANAVKAQNTVRISKLVPADQDYYNAITKHLQNYGYKLVESEYNFMGGGTMYLLFFAGRDAECYDAIKALLLKKGVAKKRLYVNDVVAKLEVIGKALKSNDGEKMGDTEAAIASYHSARASFDEVTRLASLRTVTELAYLIEVCDKWAKFTTN
ncbi:MAG: hypothetical protein J0L72_10010 [Armatimonadetes bacterium]|nr:hypothetical protein [Armatimonadota bacterium]